MSLHMPHHLPRITLDPETTGFICDLATPALLISVVPLMAWTVETNSPPLLCLLLLALTWLARTVLR